MSAGSGDGGGGDEPRSDNKNVHNDFTVDDRLDTEMEGFQARGVRISRITEVLRPRVA